MYKALELYVFHLSVRACVCVTDGTADGVTAHVA